MAFHSYSVLQASAFGIMYRRLSIYICLRTPDRITRICMQISHLAVITELVEVRLLLRG
jgi:hypothetical protein